MNELEKAIEATKRNLAAKAHRLGYVSENFGQQEARRLMDKYAEAVGVMAAMKLVGDFELWAMDYEIFS